MILKTSNNLESNLNFSEFERKEFDIEVNDKMFDLLSSKIYENPIRAIVRELSCNAIDAHIEKGIVDPIEVYLPTRDEPTLIVKDFGVGMSEEELFTIYSSYGCSTKSHTNDLIGSLGLGSKTPLAYTSQFNVSSSKDGIKTNCLIFKNENGKPQIMKLSSETTEETGTTIEVPIQKEDIFSFIEAAYMSFIFFRNVPEIKRNEEQFYFCTKYPDHTEEELEDAKEEYFNANEIIYAGKGVDNVVDLEKVFGLNSRFKNLFVYYGSPIGIIMGSIFYTIDSKIVFGDIPARSYLFNITSYKIIHVPLGSVSIQASREALSYNNETIEFLQNEFLAPVRQFASFVDHYSTEEIIKNIENFKYPIWLSLIDSKYNPDYVTSLIKRRIIVEDSFMDYYKVKNNPNTKYFEKYIYQAYLEHSSIYKESISDVLGKLFSKTFTGAVLLNDTLAEKFGDYFKSYQHNKKIPSYIKRVLENSANILGTKILLLYTSASTEYCQENLKIPTIDFDSLEITYKEKQKQERLRKVKPKPKQQVFLNCFVFSKFDQNERELPQQVGNSTSIEELKSLSEQEKSIVYVVYTGEFNVFNKFKIFDPDFVTFKKLTKNNIIQNEFYFNTKGCIHFVNSPDYVAYINYEFFLESEIWSWKNCYYIKDWYIKEYVDRLLPMKEQIMKLERPHRYYCSGNSINVLEELLPEYRNKYPQLTNSMFFKQYELSKQNISHEETINKLRVELANLSSNSLLKRRSTLIPEYTQLVNIAEKLSSSLQDKLDSLETIDHWDEFCLKYPMLKYFMSGNDINYENIADIVEYVNLIEKAS